MSSNSSIGLPTIRACHSFFIPVQGRTFRSIATARDVGSSDWVILIVRRDGPLEHGWEIILTASVGNWAIHFYFLWEIRVIVILVVCKNSSSSLIIHSYIGAKVTEDKSQGTVCVEHVNSFLACSSVWVVNLKTHLDINAERLSSILEWSDNCPDTPGFAWGNRLSIVRIANTTLLS